LDEFKRHATPLWSESVIAHWAQAQQQNDPNVLKWLDELKVPIGSWLTHTPVPILLLYCNAESGGVVQPNLVDALAQRLPYVSATCIPAAGHYIRFDQPAAFFVAVHAFLRAQRLLP